MPLKRAFGTATLPVAGVSAVAIAAVIGYFFFTGTERGDEQSSPSDQHSAPVADIATPKAAPEVVVAETPSEPAPKPDVEVEAASDNAPAVAPQTAPQAEPEREAVENASEPEAEIKPSDDTAQASDAQGAAGVVEAETAETTEVTQPEASPAQAASDSVPSSDVVEMAETTVDVVRIPSSGVSTVAGRAEAGADIFIFVDGIEVARAKAGASGDYVALFDLPSVDHPREMQIAAQKDGNRVFASDSIVIAPVVAAPSEVTSETQMASAETADETARPSADIQPVETANAESTEVEATDTAQASAETAVQTTTAMAEKTVAEEQPKPDAAPTIMVANDDGVKILQSSGPIKGVSIDAITYDPNGGVFASGRGTRGALVRLYLDNDPLMDARVGADGQWRTELQVAAGLYTLRADMVDEAGKVLGRVEIPFQREDVAVLAGLSDQDTSADAQVASTDAEQSGTSDQSVSDTPADQLDAPQPRMSSITVQPGNTLWGIASDTYGEGRLYARVFDANAAQIRDPDLIYPGQVFVLPPSETR
ncbi:MAG: LysM peptidoglycan-binding domain-containing protein [Pacificibacter sp.]|uniref:LysM peptidoglycan-binding domain-containing protein n=1 Tax=Pacificibacter sp. TaxID=1917866 RepID=UPI00321BCC3B